MIYRLLRHRRMTALILLFLWGLSLTFAPRFARAQDYENPQAAAPGTTVFALATAAGLGAQPQRLISFEITSPGTIRSDLRITGLQAGETLKGIDFRPATGQLYGLGSSSRLYTININNGVATLVGANPFTPAIAATNFFGFDFNPVPDRIRVVGNTDQQNLRLVPNTGATASTDTNVAYAAGDPNVGQLPNIVGAAYTNNVAGATSTTNYAIDARTDGTVRLVTQGSVDGSPTSPNTGQLFTIGNLRTGTTNIPSNNLVGFDISIDGTAYVSLTPVNPFNAPSTLYTVNLTTAEVASVGQIGSGLRVDGLAIATPLRPGTQIQFAPLNYSVAENAGNLTVTVTRTGDTLQPATIDYRTNDIPGAFNCASAGGMATARCDYESASGRLNFASGEVSRTFIILLNDDAFVEGNETLMISLSNPSDNATIVSGDLGMATITITDNDTTTPTTNPIDDTTFFVRQQYLDFLNREPDPGGLAFWTGQITQCGSDAACINNRRVDVSAAFFIEQEFQQRGYFVIRLYRAAFNRRPTFMEFIRDWQSLTRATSPADLVVRQNMLASDFTTTDEFRGRFGSLSDSDFVTRLYQTANITLTSTERSAIVNDLAANNISRGQALRNLIERADFRTREYNTAFVLAEYFGYLRRDPDESGFQFWLNVLNTSGNFRFMVCNFITSAEYQMRFSSVVTRTNATCNGF